MSLLSKEKAKKSLVLGTYIIAGGVSSVLILFFIRQSFFFGSQPAKKYHRDIDVALDEVHKLEHKLWQDFLTAQFNIANPGIADEADELDTLEADLKSQINAVNQSIVALKTTPAFLSQQQQEQIQNNLKNQEILLATRYQAIEQLQSNQAVFHQSCRRIASLKQDLVHNQGSSSPKLIGDRAAYLEDNRQLRTSINDLLDLSVAYCQTKDHELIPTIQSQTQDILLTL